MPALQGWVWEHVMPGVRDAWQGHHAQHGDTRYDWRLTWPEVRDGWRDAGGRFAPAMSEPADLRGAPVSEQEPPRVGMHVFDMFSAPVGRVKDVRTRDFLLARPWARDVYVPFDAVRERGETWLRVRVPYTHLGAQGWAHPGLLGSFGRTRPSRHP
jgi:hypothetical protein